MKINVEDIPSCGLELHSTLENDSLLGELQSFKAEELKLYSPISSTLKITKSHKNIFIKGNIQTNLTLTCSRCLKESDYPLTSDLEYTFCPTNEEEFVDDLELRSEELEFSFYKGEQIDLSQVIIEHIIIAIPLKPLCHVSCKGLCPKCGIDLNQDICECSKGNEFNIGFSELGNFKTESRR
ncbi:MAG: DUF177 domain-containing protein [Thermodesulfobacteriota bacterium]|nr:DUF177 domain-containing protein [Thermodesulfobacteriota bacterium]